MHEDKSQFVKPFFERDGTAWSDAANHYSGWLCAQLRGCYGLTEDLAEDFVQEAFLRAFRDLPQFTPRDCDPHPVRTWLWAKCHFVVMEHFRALGRFTRHKEPFGHASLWRNRRARDDEQLIAAIRAIDELKPEDRKVIVLHYYEAQTCVEIAQEMGTTEGAVKARLHRARQALAARISIQRDHQERGEAILEMGGER